MEEEKYVVTHGEKTVRIRPSLLTTETLGLAFNLFPDRIILESDDGTIELPNRKCQFVDIDSSIVWVCSGTSISQPPTQPGPSSINYAYQQPKQKKFSPVFTTELLSKNKPPGVVRQETSKKSWNKVVQICTWDDASSSWTKIENLPIQLTEETATVPYITDRVSQDSFGGAECVLVDKDYLAIPNTSSTRGNLDCVGLFLVVT